MPPLRPLSISERVSSTELFGRLRQQTRDVWWAFFFGDPKVLGKTACLAMGNQTSKVPAAA